MLKEQLCKNNLSYDNVMYGRLQNVQILSFNCRKIKDLGNYCASNKYIFVFGPIPTNNNHTLPLIINVNTTMKVNTTNKRKFPWKYSQFIKVLFLFHFLLQNTTTTLKKEAIKLIFSSLKRNESDQQNEFQNKIRVFRIS